MIKDILSDIIKPFTESISPGSIRLAFKRTIDNGNRKVFADTFLQKNENSYVCTNAARNLSYGSSDTITSKSCGDRGGMYGFIELKSYWDLRVDCPTGGMGSEAFTFTNDTGLMVNTPGNNSQKFYDSSNNYTSKNPTIYPGRGHAFYFSLTNDLGIVAGGSNTTSVPNVSYSTCERYSDSSDAWITRTNRSSAAGIGASISLTSDTMLSSSGYNGSGSVSLSYKYTNSTDIWISRISTYRSTECRGTSINSDSGLMCGGNNGGGSNFLNFNYIYYDSINSYRVGAIIPYSVMEHATFTLSEQTAVISGGYNASSMSIDRSGKYTSGANAWQLLVNCLINRDDISSISLGSNKGITSRGHCVGGPYDGTTLQTIRYNHFTAPSVDPYGSTAWSSSQFDFFNSDFESQDIYCPLPSSKEISVETVNLLIQDSPIDGVFAYCKTFSKDNNPNISVSLDGGRTYNEHQVNGTIIPTDDLPPDELDGKYKLKLKFNLQSKGEYWTSKISMPFARTAAGGCYIDTDQGIIHGGWNSTAYPTTALSATERYSKSQNTWLSRANMGVAKDDAYMMNLYWGCGVSCGGANGHTMGSNLGVDATTQRYSSVQDCWVQKSDMPISVTSASVCSMSSYDGVCAGGQNSSTSWATGTTNIYRITTNVWLNQLSMLQPRYDSQALPFDGYYMMVAGGSNGPGSLDTCERFAQATASWSSRSSLSNISPGKRNHYSIGLTPNKAIIAGGYNSSGVTNDYNSIIYFMSADYWTCNLQIPEVMVQGSCFGHDTYSGLISGGINGYTAFYTLTSASYQYNNGNMDFIGFTAIPISKK